MPKLDHVEGIGPAYREKLESAGVQNTDQLLDKGATPTGRNELADATGISKSLILEWVNHCDLYRISGVGEEYADLLEEAGVDTVPELAQRNATNLYQKMTEINEQKKLVRQIPSENQVQEWISQASGLDRKITY